MRRHDASVATIHAIDAQTVSSDIHKDRRAAPSSSQSGFRCCLFVVVAVANVGYLVVFPKILSVVGESSLAMGNRQAALRAYDRVLRIWPRLFDADAILFSRGTLLMSHQEQWEHRQLDAEADLRAVIASQPDHTNAHFNLGLLLSQMSDGARASEAVVHMRKAIALAESAGEAPDDLRRRRHDLGTLLLQEARTEEAAGMLLYPHLDATRSHAAADITTFPVTRAQRVMYVADSEGVEAVQKVADGTRAPRSMPTGATEFMDAHVLSNVLAVADCEALVAIAEVHAQSHGGWTHGRHEAYPTTDLPLSVLPQSAPSVTNVLASLRDVLLPTMVRSYPSLTGLPLVVDDAFVAKYAAHTGTDGAAPAQGLLAAVGASSSSGAQSMLAFHKDGTPLSFICTLAEPTAGGGTVFRALLPSADAARVRAGDATAVIDMHGAGERATLVAPTGDCLIFAGGALLHGGVSVTSGVRHLLIGFVEVGRAGADVGGRGRYALYRAQWSATKEADDKLQIEMHLR